MSINAPAPKPCASCPYRRDVPSGIWAATEYKKLPEYDRDTAYQPQGLFQCHQTEKGSDKAQLCAGWVACHGDQLLALRLAAAMHSMDETQLDKTFNYSTTVPVFNSGAEAAEHGMREIEWPGQDAAKALTKIAKRRTDIREG